MADPVVDSAPVAPVAVPAAPPVVAPPAPVVAGPNPMVRPVAAPVQPAPVVAAPVVPKPEPTTISVHSLLLNSLWIHTGDASFILVPGTNASVPAKPFRAWLEKNADLEPVKRGQFLVTG